MPKTIDGAALPTVSYSKSFIFIANPKAASTSIQTALSLYQERSDLDDVCEPGLYTRRHLPALRIRDRLSVDAFECMLSFSVVRNPYDWMASQLNYNLRSAADTSFRNRKLTSHDVLQCYDILKQRRGQIASPSGTQWAFLCDEQKQLLVDLPLPLDDLEVAWNYVCARIGIEVGDLPILNKHSHPPWDEWLARDAIELIDIIYADDFRLYEYSKRWRQNGG